MFALVLMALAGCAPQPASITLAGDPTVQIHDLAARPLPAVTVLDGADMAIEPAPPYSWTVQPAEIAEVNPTTDTLVPLSEGTAQIIVTSGAATASFTLEVRLPDEVQLSGVTDGQIIEVGSLVPVKAQALDDRNPLVGLAVLWSTDNANVASVVDGTLQALAPGEATLTASAGDKSASVEIRVVEPQAEPEETLEAAG